MKTNTLISRIRREITSSPKKAAILGLLLLVAIGYWTPLVWGWIKPESTKGKKTASSTTTTDSTNGKSAALETSTTTASEETKHAWKDIRQWIETDPRMIATKNLAGRPHPFDPVQLPSEIQETEKQNQDKTVASLGSTLSDPSSLGLKLSSTIVGARKQAALINGKSYLLGETIQINHDGRSFEFQLTEIHDDSIVLRRDDKPYTIRLPKPESSDQLSIKALQDD